MALTSAGSALTLVLLPLELQPPAAAAKPTATRPARSHLSLLGIALSMCA